MEIVEQVAGLLGGKPLLGLRIRTWSELDRAVRAGLPKRSLQLVAGRAADVNEPVSTFVHKVVPPATFKRRVRLSANESERTERLARVIAMAENIWRDQAETRAFLNRPHPLLDGQTPVNTARTELGARRVEQLLHDAAHGLCV